MRKLLALWVVVYASMAMAVDVPTNKVLLRGLDKTIGRSKTFTARVGEPVQFGELTIVVDKCLKRPIDEAPENTAFLTVEESETGTEVFQGWMFSSNPALSAMEHPVYDVWVLECQNSDSSSVLIPTVASDIEVKSLDEADLSQIDD